MYDPISVDTALVSANGDLLISLTDGNIVNAGKVRGAQGIQGERGYIGERGEPGRNGVDGAQWHTGVGMPELSLGTAGDLYMDVANSLLPIYQKVGNDWLLLCNLKVPPSGGGGGAGGAAGGGGSIIIYPKPDGGAPPSTDNEGKPIDKGDIWLDTNTGWLWVYDGTTWIPVGDRPPVIISPNPPLWNSSGDTDNRYPIVEGSLWFDSDQLALYVAAKDSGNNLVWVITIPADRSVLLNEVPVNPFIFVFPASAAGTYANDGDTVYNPTTELWYIYNGSKNQWIDLPPGRQEVSLQAILLRGADNFPTTFEYEPADRVTYDTEALSYVNEDNHEDFTRIVVPFIDTAGFDWTFLLRGIRKGDQLSLVQIDAGDPLDPDDDSPFRSDYLTISDITENAESINVDIEHQQENPPHLPLFGETVAIRFKAIVNVGDREIYYQEDAPDLINNPNLLEGNLWVDSDDNKMYVWDGSSWSEVTTCTAGGGVDKAYVDARDQLLQREIEVLQEEIEAITPTTEKGIWQDGASATPGTGHFAMRVQGGAITQNYEDSNIDKIIISTTAKDGSAHSFLTEEVGDLIQLFDVEDKNYGLFEITAIDTTSSTQYVNFDVTWLQGLGETNVDDDVLVRTFAPPSGGTASEFVLKAGDTFEGELKWFGYKPAADGNPAENKYNGIKMYSRESSTKYILLASTGSLYDKESLRTSLEPRLTDSITNKKYVDGLWDFSQYPELT